jgi:hypothetical protein
MTLQEVNEFTTDKQFSQVKDIVYGLVKDGELRECGLDSSDPWHFIEVFKSIDGSEWHMAIPDHAFRGYLRKVR